MQRNTQTNLLRRLAIFVVLLAGYGLVNLYGDFFSEDTSMPETVEVAEELQEVIEAVEESEDTEEVDPEVEDESQPEDSASDSDEEEQGEKAGDTLTHHETIHLFYKNITDGNLGEAYGLYEEPKISLETFKGWYGTTTLAEASDINMIDENVYRFTVELTEGGNVDYYTTTMRVENGKIETLSAKKNENVCTDEPEESMIGRYIYPTAEKYKGYQWLGELFTADDCGYNRLEEYVRSSQGEQGPELRWHVGVGIDMHPGAPHDFVNLLLELGFVCNTAGDLHQCERWDLWDSVSVKDLLRLKWHIKHFTGGDCRNCG